MTPIGRGTDRRLTLRVLRLTWGVLPVLAVAACASQPRTEPDDTADHAANLDAMVWSEHSYRAERLALRRLTVGDGDVDHYRVLDPVLTADRDDVERLAVGVCVTSGAASVDVRLVDEATEAEVGAMTVDRETCRVLSRPVGVGSQRIVVEAAGAGEVGYGLTVTRVRNDLSYRGINAGGPWGTQYEYLEAEREMPTEQFLDWAHEANTNWVAINVALHLDTYADTTIEVDSVACREPSCHYFPTWTDEYLAQMLDELAAAGFDTAIELSIWYDRIEQLQPVDKRPIYDRWQLGCVDRTGPPGLDRWWEPCYNDGAPHDPACIGDELAYLQAHDTPHEAARAEFFTSYEQQATHYAALARDHGVDLVVLGIETDCLFRTRPGSMVVDYRPELSAMVAAVREVYGGAVSYQAHHANLSGAGAGTADVWDDLGLDLVAVSGYYPLADHNPALKDSCDDVPDPTQVRLGWQRVFDHELVPLRQRYPDKPVVLIEFGVTDDVATPCYPLANDGAEYDDLDDALRGRATQAIVLQQFFAVADEMADARGAPVVDGAFLWDIWMVDHAEWFIGFFDVHTFTVRDKPAEQVVLYAF